MVFGREAAHTLLPLDGAAARTLEGRCAASSARRDTIARTGECNCSSSMADCCAARCWQARGRAGYTTFAMIGRHPYGVIFLDLPTSQVDPTSIPPRATFACATAPGLRRRAPHDRRDAHRTRKGALSRPSRRYGKCRSILCSAGYRCEPGARDIALRRPVSERGRNGGPASGPRATRSNLHRRARRRGVAVGGSTCGPRAHCLRENRRFRPRCRLERAAARAPRYRTRCSAQRRARSDDRACAKADSRSNRSASAPTGSSRPRRLRCSPLRRRRIYRRSDRRSEQRDVRERIWASLACHSVTIAGERLEADEMTTLVDRLQQCDQSDALSARSPDDGAP